MIKSTQRIFIPGSKWVYFKIYAGHKTLENILVKDVYSIISKLKKEQIIEKWFFIRYADPDSHLRIRMLLNDEIKVGDTVNMIYRQLNYLVKDNFIWKIQLDTYHRELERYGNRLIEDTETLFFRDSECILSIIRLLNINKNEDFRWMIALKLIDCLLSDFNFNLIQKHSLMENISDSFKKEYGFNQY
ncbi:thiopeptide-type bacteriocin biosynthesis protein, partial [Dysgonomonas sp. Marseille-P4677]|uniref:thiopeptide-type bacteriocin biosynthesis protein n=1 Tax=Dysgonomonas sp. Marseille-P4677 TaxID=2364790 RepID=UPI0019115537